MIKLVIKIYIIKYIIYLLKILKYYDEKKMKKNEKK